MNQPDDRKVTPHPALANAPPHRPPVAANMWDGIKVGSLVLAAGFDQHDLPAGWWEAVIVAIDRDEYTLKWRDYPREPTSKRERKHIALLHPAF